MKNALAPAQALADKKRRNMKIASARLSAPGYIFGVDKTPYCTDDEVLRVIELKDELAAIHIRALGRMKWGDIQTDLK
jgi:hypothetical protein